MSQYLAVLVWIFAVAVLSYGIEFYRDENLYGMQVRRIGPWWAVIFMLPLIYWAAVRPGGVFDTGLYARTFQVMPVSFGQLPQYVAELSKDRGYYLLASIIHILAGNQPKIYFGIVAGIQGLCLMRMLRKYSVDYILSLFIFVASTDYFSWMHNGIRQFLAVTIILAGTDFIVEKKYVKAILVILFASLFHASALLMIPIIFIVQGKPWNLKTILLIIASLFIIVFIDRFTRILEMLLSDTQYTNVVSDWESWQDNGTNPLRVLVYSVPMIISIVGYRYIEEANNPIMNIMVNMSIVTTALYLVSMFTSGIFIGRLPVYCSIYATCILLPWELRLIFTKRSVSLVTAILVAAYLFFFYFQCHMIWGIL